MANIKKAKNRIDKIQLKWLNSDPIMLGIWCLMEKVPDKKQTTMGIDTKTNPPTIRFNPNFVNTLSEEILEMVMAAEGFKLLLRHPTTRLKNPKEISNLASSVTVDQMVAGSVLNFKEIKDTMPMPDMFGLEQNKFFEEYFRKLLDMSEEVKKKVQQVWNDLSEEEQEEISNSSASKDDTGEDSESEGNGKSGQDGEDGDDQEAGDSNKQVLDEDGYQTFDGEGNQDALKDHFDPNGDTNDNWGENEMLDADIKNMVDDKAGSMKQWGKFTQDHMDSVISANKPKISYKEVIRRFNTSVITGTSVTSRMKVNRRHDLVQPGYRREYKAKIIFAVDTSGSMSEEDLAEGFAVINNICKHSEIEYVLFDTEIKLKEKKRKNAQTHFKVLGRGGTDFQCVVDYANTQKVDGLVIFTDGYASAPTKPKTKVLWLLHSKEQKPPVDWGFKTHLNRFER